eukprot:15269353-Alexandrium_andersonii.AAC.1
MAAKDIRTGRTAARSASAAGSTRPQGATTARAWRAPESAAPPSPRPNPTQHRTQNTSRMAANK